MGPSDPGHFYSQTSSRVRVNADDMPSCVRQQRCEDTCSAPDVHDPSSVQAVGAGCVEPVVLIAGVQLVVGRLEVKSHGRQKTHGGVSAATGLKREISTEARQGIPHNPRPSSLLVLGLGSPSINPARPGDREAPPLRAVPCGWRS